MTKQATTLHPKAIPRAATTLSKPKTAKQAQSQQQRIAQVNASTKPSAAAELETARIPATSLWHSMHTPLVDRLMDVALAGVEEGEGEVPPEEVRDRRVLTAVLAFLVAQFGEPKTTKANKSSRAVAAAAFCDALVYSAFVDAAAFGSLTFDFKNELERARELRLLLLLSLAALCRNLDKDNKRFVFRLTVDSDQDDAELLLDTLIDAILSLVDLACPHPLHNRPRDIMVLIAWRSRRVFRDLLAALDSAADKCGYRGVLMLEYFLKGMLKGLNKLEKRCVSGVDQDQMKILTAMFADCSLLLSRSITCLPLLASHTPHRQPTSIKLMSHPLLLLKHIVNPIVRLAIWNPAIHAFVASLSGQLSSYIRECCKELSKPKVDKKTVSFKENHPSTKHTSGATSTAAATSSSLSSTPGTLPWLISEALASTIHVAGFLETLAKWMSLDSEDGSDTRISITSQWQGSDVEREAFGRWAFYITEHLFSQCPVLANPNIYAVTTKSLHLPTLSDPRHKAIVKVAHDLLARLESQHPVPNIVPPPTSKQTSSSSSTPYTKQQLFSLHHCITFIATAILEGSKSSDAIPYCDNRVLRALAQVLHKIRHTETPLLRSLLLESLARLLGASILIDRVNQTQSMAATTSNPRDILGDLLPDFKAQQPISEESRESLGILYRLVKGVEPFEGDEDIQQRVLWSSNGGGDDLVDMHERVRLLKGALLNYGELVHLHVLFREREFEVKRFSKSHGFGGGGGGSGGGVEEFDREERGRGVAEIPQRGMFTWAHWEVEEVSGKRGEVKESLGRPRRRRSGSRHRIPETRFEEPPVSGSAPNVTLHVAPQMAPPPTPSISSVETVKQPHSFELDSKILEKIASEEALVLEEFRRRIQCEPVLEYVPLKATSSPVRAQTSASASTILSSVAAPVLTKSSPTAPVPFSSRFEHGQVSKKIVSQSVDILNQSNRRHGPTASAIKKFSSSYIVNKTPPPPPTGEGASILFQKTERYFEDAFNAIRPSPTFANNKPQQDYGSRQCLDEELESIISEHESSLKRAEEIESTVFSQSASLANRHQASSARQSAHSFVGSAAHLTKKNEGASVFLPIDLGEMSIAEQQEPSISITSRDIEIPQLVSSLGSASEVGIRPPTPIQKLSSSPRTTQRAANFAVPAASESVLNSGRKAGLFDSERRASIATSPTRVSAKSPTTALERIEAAISARKQAAAAGQSSLKNLQNAGSVAENIVASKPGESRTSGHTNPLNHEISDKEVQHPQTLSKISSASSLSSSPKKVEFGRTSVHHYLPKESFVQSMGSLSLASKTVSTSTSVPSSPKTSTAVKVFVDVGTSATAPSTMGKSSIAKMFVDSATSATSPAETKKRSVGVETTRILGESKSPLMGTAVNRASSPQLSVSNVNMGTPLPKSVPLLHGSIPLQTTDAMNSGTPLAVSGSKNVIQNTWLLRRMDYAKSPTAQTPVGVTSPSLRSKLSRAFSADGDKIVGGDDDANVEAENVLHSKVGIGAATTQQHDLNGLGTMEDDGQLMMGDLSGLDLELQNEGDGHSETNAVNLDAFLAGNGLVVVGGENDDAGGGGQFESRMGGDSIVFDEPDFFGDSMEFHHSEGDNHGYDERLASEVVQHEIPPFPPTGPLTHDFILDASLRQSRRVSDPFLGDHQYMNQPVMVPITPAPAHQPADAPYTGMSVFRNDSMNLNEPSGIPQTPGSPLSFSWTNSQSEFSLANRIQTAMEGDTGGDYEFNAEDERQLSLELTQKNDAIDQAKTHVNQASTLSFFKNIPSFSNLASNTSTSMVRPRLRAALELVLRHLVFAFPPKGGREDSDKIDYYELYSDGLVYGSLMNLAAFPIAGNQVGGKGFSNTSELEAEEAPISEALHPLLKSVFQLDMSLMVDLCGPMTMGTVASQSTLELEKSASKRLHKWLAGLTEVHRFLLAASRAIFHVENQLAAQLTLAQAMVVVKDQISIARMTGGGMHQMDGTNVGGGSATFMEWVSACCHTV
ncbi:UNVERIFIED_CONTAM: hypothetical protein HDU68_008088 [Siphonaria sp. JEL0065]|nr:hypothetical protein HDU68_008088 [Siphonaria sp. JEL0065]